MTRALLIIAVFFFVSCKQREGRSSTKAFVSYDVADKGYAIIKKIDYLPFSYKEDGCYARALYMSMELAVQKIPSSS